MDHLHPLFIFGLHKHIMCDLLTFQRSNRCEYFLLWPIGRSCLVWSFTFVVVHVECSNMLREKTWRRSVGALRTLTLLRDCLLKFSIFKSVSPTHVFHIWIVIGAKRFVLSATTSCGGTRLITNNSTHRGSLSGTNVPLVCTDVCLSFYVWELWMSPLKSSSAVMFAGKILNFANNG